MQYNTIQYFINPFLLGFSGLIYIRLKIELNISNKIITSNDYLKFVYLPSNSRLARLLKILTELADLVSEVRSLKCFIAR